MNERINIGILGISSGNGHPYSWSAIFNGYNPNIMKNCGFPVIPEYLGKQNFPDSAIHNAKVGYIWTQDINLSRKIAQASLIENVVENYQDMIGHVDAILLARDDAENHYQMSKPFIEAGLPIFIDKPLAYSLAEAKKIIGLQQYNGQIFSCSSLRYAEEFKLSTLQKKDIGEIRHIFGFVPKDWKKYSVHLIDPLLDLIPNRGKILDFQKYSFNCHTRLYLQYEKIGVTLQSFGDLNSPIGFRLIGTKGWKDLYFQDTFSAFKSSLLDFVRGVINREERISVKRMLDVVSLIEKGI